jgi:hypothetical protein
MKKIINTLILFFLFISSLASAAEKVKSLKSLDGKLIAKITQTQKAAEGPPEFIIEVIDSEGKIIAKQDFTSEDGSHGLSIDKVEWTPDSQFLVFSTFSSGGHQAWQTPTLFFDRRDSKIHGFEEFLAPISEGDFVLKSPDIITITIWTPMTPEKTLDESIELPITFSMQDLKLPKK